MNFKETIFWTLFFLCVTVEAAKENNIALGKNCSQLKSFDDTDNSFEWKEDKAVDGCINQTHPVSSKCCSASLGGAGNFWQVDLGSVYSVGKLIVYGRTDTQNVGAQLSGFHVYGQTQEGVGADQERLYNNTDITPPADQRYEIIVNPSRNISIVRIERPNANIITLCEVQVYEACDDGYFGSNCTNKCGWCRDNASCDKVSGSCPGGCQAGWTGLTCVQKCTSPNFGADCLHVCNCANNATCNHVTGLCPGGECAAGWQGQSCNHECQNFTFGPNCVASCGPCANGTKCDVISGICELGCAPGWLNPTCNVSCDFGYFGINCTGVCGHCRNNETCHLENGTCGNGCSAGWQGDTCDNECSNGTYGPDCLGRCYCANREPCDKVTGVCPTGCDFGIVGDFCNIDLNRAINKTANQSSTWNSDGFLWVAERAIDGNFLQSGSARTCSATEPGNSGWWLVDMESVTRIEFITVYGREETSTELAGFKMYLQNTTDIIDMTTILANTSTDYDSAGVPYNNGVYNISFNGTRTARYIIISRQNARGLSLCEVRVFGECRDGTFGLSCDGLCYCKDVVPCNKETGRCPAGCAPGWNGTQCSQPCSSGTYGTDCSGKCGACANATSCEFTDGVCEAGCSDGWLSSMCNISCSAGMYGAYCSSKCGQCKGGPCNHMTGECDQGCLAGFHGSDCQTSCSNGTYGENCAMTCGKCANETICDGTNGFCPLGCKDGLVPPLCANAATQTSGDNSDDTNVGAIVGGIFGGVAFVIIIGVVYKLCTKRSKLSKMDKAMAYYPSMMTKETRPQPTGAVNSGYSMEEGVPSKDSAHPDYVPSLFSFTPVNKIHVTPNKVERINRLKRRRLALTPIHENTQGEDLDSAAQALLDLRSDLPRHLDQGTDPDPLMKKVEQLTLENSQLNMECQLLRNENRQMKEQLQQDKFTYTNLDNSRISHFTGLPSMAVFRWILVIVGLSLKSVGKLCAGDMLLMVLMKLRHNMTNKDLALRFHICPTQVSRIINQCLPILSRKLKFLIKWPCKSTILKNMPKSFRRNYKKCRVIIDCSEVFIQRHSNLDTRAKTWSNYKHHNTMKFRVGITPYGAISFLSKCWGGRISDKEITEKSGFYDKLEHNDLVLVDRGFLISEELAARGASLAIPPFAKGKSQFSQREVETARKLSRSRIHVERAIERIKRFRILSNTMPVSMMTHCDDILTICGARYFHQN